MNETLAKMFDDINSVDDILEYVGDTEDGENDTLEMKQVDLNLANDKSGTKGNVDDFKATIAKEMCAFANTNGGILIIGISYSNKNRSIEVSNKTASLEDWLDKNVRDLIEPHITIRMKSLLCETMKNRPVIIMVPKGNVIPYRVASIKHISNKKDIPRQYYQRIGTSSEPIPYSIVRDMHRVLDRPVTMSMRTRAKKCYLDIDSQRYILELEIVVKPDETHLIKDFYVNSEVVLLTANCCRINKDIIYGDGGLEQIKLIPPTTSEVLFNTIRLAGVCKNRNDPYPVGFILDDIENIDFVGFWQIFAIYTKTKYACDGLPLKTDNRLIIVGDKHHADGGFVFNDLPADDTLSTEELQVVNYTDCTHDILQEYVRSVLDYLAIHK